MGIHINGVDELIEKLARIDKLEIVRAYLRAAAEYLKGKFATYPQQGRLTRTEVYGYLFASPAQQRFFFAALASGEIVVPYHRGEAATSERLGQSWTVSEEDGGLTQVLGNDTSYGPYVMGDSQSLFMQYSGWPTASEVAYREEGTVVSMVKDGLDQELE